MQRRDGYYELDLLSLAQIFIYSHQHGNNLHVTASTVLIN